MPTSLVIGALVVAWLVVLVPMVARRRQEVAKTADSVLAARVVRSGAARSRLEERAMPDTDQAKDTHAVRGGNETTIEANADGDSDGVTVELPLPHDADPMAEDTRSEYHSGDGGDEDLDVVHADDLPFPARRYKPGRGGFDPEAAEIDKQAKYARRRRIVLGMLIAAVATALFAAVAWTAMWWLQALIDIGLVGYLTYLRRQVRIEDDIRRRRMSRMRAARAEPEPGLRAEHHAPDKDVAGDAPDTGTDGGPSLPRAARAPVSRHYPGTAVVDIDDGDPEFDELNGLDSLPYRKAAGE